MKYLLTIIALFFFLQNHAQQLSLQDAINIALKNSYEIQIAKNNVSINTINNDLAIAGGKPSINGTLSDQENIIGINQKLNNGTIINRNAVGSNNINANITASMLLYNGYRVVTTKKRLEVLQKQSEVLVNVEVQAIMENVMLKYYDIIRQQSFIKTLEESINLSKTQLELIQAKKKIGLANNADEFQSQIDLNTRLLDLQNQQLIVKQSKTDLLDLLQLNPDSTLTIKDSIVADKNIVLANILNNIRSNPEIVALDQQIKINEFLEKETAALRKPTIRATTGMNFGRTQSGAGQILLNQSYGPFIGVGLTIPLYSAGVFKRQEQIAGINTKNAKLRVENTISNYQTVVVKTYNNYIGSLQQLETQKVNLALTEKLLALSMERLKLGATTIIEVREAQKSFEDAAYRLINLNYAAKVAEINLKRISNQLGN